MDTFDSGVCHGAPFVDPDGNPLQLHSRYAPLEPFAVPEQDVLRTDFIGVNVRDRGQASDFYGKLGLTRNPNSSDEWPEFEASNVGLVLSTPEQKGGGDYAPEYGVALRVADVGEAMERLQGEGVEFEFPQVYDSGVCHMAFFKDPDGNGLMLHHRYAPYRDGTQP
jgi:catechol 2,3-dioxygenase-like lactoylglutathione lyase family enzyme